MKPNARQINRMRQLRSAGYTLEGIACAFGLEVAAVRDVLRAPKTYDPVERQRRLREQAIAELLAEGRDPAVIAAVFGSEP